MKSSFLLLYFVAAPLLLRAPVAASPSCDLMELSPCASAILTAAPPTAACCTKLKEQQHCLCQYEKDPRLRGYVNTGNGRKVAGICEVPIPKC
ncbi:hypothetical protein HPP92_011275 [Vanilla planifolia]|uniref:Bifunctional inhibitor/plant lipid transfer protein/seed storage helical domain-containing protein n=1 Tax=Vanilla planifolia TaxID=51239 RepID=A0A835R7B6_VANPL|nr:hypothetical protein HPP92_011575 [Vanilla planifolia]KAG0483191.1 hypothetical protein HPP92_011275 [Vanilla planifolia]